MLRRENRFERTASSLARLLPFVIAFSCLVFVVNAASVQASPRTRAILSPAMRLCPDLNLTAAPAKDEDAPSICRPVLNATLAFSYPAPADPVLTLSEPGHPQIAVPVLSGRPCQVATLPEARPISVRLRGPPV